MKQIKTYLLCTFIIGNLLWAGCQSNSSPEDKAASHMDSVRQNLEKANTDLDSKTKKLEASLEKIDELAKKK